MSTDSNNTSIAKDQKNEGVLEFLVEQYGEKVEEMVEKADSSYAKLKFKGEKDDLAKFVEDMHYHPLNTHGKLMSTMQYLLGALVHEKIMKELIAPNKKWITAVYSPKSGTVGVLNYLVQLNTDSFDIRNHLREGLFEIYDQKPYASHVSVDIDFIPEDATEDDLNLDKIIKIQLEEIG